jgi:2-methylcitrate dehydratase PrpD
MGKSFHPGRAAESGYLAVVLAEQGFTAGAESLDGPRGYMNVLSARHDAVLIGDRLGAHFILRENAYKPYACGLVIHPTIDACSQIRLEAGFKLDSVASVSLQVSPIVFDLCNKKDIQSGLESKFSVYHAAAIGLARGKGGLGEFTDDAVHDPVIKRMRECVRAVEDPSLPDQAVIVDVRCNDGTVLHKRVDDPIGSLSRPLSDRMLEDKFREQATLHLTGQAVDELSALMWRIDCISVSDVIRAATSSRNASRLAHTESAQAREAPLLIEGAPFSQ